MSEAAADEPVEDAPSMPSTATARAWSGFVAGWVVLGTVIFGIFVVFGLQNMLLWDVFVPLSDVLMASLFVALLGMPTIGCAPLIGLAISALPAPRRPLGGAVLGVALVWCVALWIHGLGREVHMLTIAMYVAFASIEMALVGAAVGVLQQRLEGRIGRKR